MENEQEKKKLSLSIESDITEPTLYHDFLIRSSEDALFIDFAKREESTSEVTIKVKESVAIPADQMKTFMLRILKELIVYEKKYKNGKGFKVTE